MEPYPKDHRAPEDMQLIDRWAPNTPIRLDGPAERGKFPPMLTVFIGLFLAWVAFQVISGVVTVLLLVGEGLAMEDLMAALATVVEEHARSLLTANTVGQVLGLAVPAWIYTRLHTPDVRPFLRLRKPDLVLLVLSVVGLVALIPLVQWLGVVNDAFPFPDWLREFERMQTDLIEKVLSQDTGLVFNLAVLALTPAICEELLFRGYVQRQAERSLGIVWGIVFSGVLFGLYHLRFTQAIPLSMLGIYMAYLTWLTGSLIPAMVVHFLNNGLAVVLGAFVAASENIEMKDIETMEMPWYIVVGGAALLAGVLYLMQQRARIQLDHLNPARQNA